MRSIIKIRKIVGKNRFHNRFLTYRCNIIKTRKRIVFEMKVPFFCNKTKICITLSVFKKNYRRSDWIKQYAIIT